MRTHDAVQHLGTKSAIARALAISAAAVTQWGEIVPLESALALEIVTQGALAVDRSLYPNLARAIEAAGEQAA